jgi:hypothetical protein
MSSLAVSGNPGVLDCAPHSEKMLYDNAQLARVYLHAWQRTRRDRLRRISLETWDCPAREMRSPASIAAPVDLWLPRANNRNA